MADYADLPRLLSPARRIVTVMDDVEDFFNSTVRHAPAEWKPKASPVGTFDTSKRPRALERWDTEANAGIDLSQVPTSLSTVAWFWRCRDGHRWRETLASVSKRGAWKRYDIPSAACRRCVLIAHGPRCPEGHLVDRVDHLNEPIASHLCRQCDPDAFDTRRADQAKARAANNLTSNLWSAATDPRHIAMTGHDRDALIAFERRVRARRARGVRWWKPVPPKKIVWDAPLGTVAPSRREAWTGKDERSLIAACVDAGLPVRTGVTVTVPDVYYPTGATWRATPDILIGDSLVIEVDHPAALRGGPSRRRVSCRRPTTRRRVPRGRPDCHPGSSRRASACARLDQLYPRQLRAGGRGRRHYLRRSDRRRR